MPVIEKRSHCYYQFCSCYSLQLLACPSQVLTHALGFPLLSLRFRLNGLPAKMYKQSRPPITKFFVDTNKKTLNTLIIKHL